MFSKVLGRWNNQWLYLEERKRTEKALSKCIKRAYSPRVFQPLSAVTRTNMVWLRKSTCSPSIWCVSKPYAPDYLKGCHGLESKIVAYMLLAEDYDLSVDSSSPTSILFLIFCPVYTAQCYSNMLSRCCILHQKNYILDADSYSIVSHLHSSNRNF